MTAAWRWVFESLRLAVEPASLVPLLLVHTSKILHSCSDLPPQEVAADIALLVQAVSDKYLPVDGAEAARICRSTCNLVIEASLLLQLEFDRDTLVALLHFFQGVVTSASTVVLLHEEGGGDAVKAKVKAVAAIGQVIYDSGSQLAVDEVSSLVSFLGGLILYPVSPEWSLNPQLGPRFDTGIRSRSENEAEVEVQRIALDTISIIFTQAGSVMSTETWKSTIQGLSTVFESVASKSSLVEDSVSSRYYASLLRCLRLLLTEPKGSLRQHGASFGGVLCMFFMYGLSSSQDKATVGNTCMYDEETGSACGWFSSDSDQSDTDGSVEEIQDLYKSSKPRANAMMAIEVLARTDAKSLNEQRSSLFPTSDVLQPRPHQPTLLTCLLFDPIFKVRVAAALAIAAILKGPAHSCLEVAELRKPAAGGSPMILLDSLGQIIIQLHTGFMHAVLNEKQSDVLVSTLNALSVLVASTPFHRLPAELLPNVVLSISKRVWELCSSSVGQSTIMEAAVSCLGAALSATLPSTSVAAMISTEVPAGKNLRINHLTQVSGSLQSDLKLYSQPPARVDVRVEAFLALKAAACRYPAVIFTLRDQVFEMVAGVLGTETESSPSTIEDDSSGVSKSFAKAALSTSGLSDDKLIHSAIKLLDECLRVISAFDMPNEPQEGGPLELPLLHVVASPKSLKLRSNLLTAASAKVYPQSSEFGQYKGGCLEWLLALESLLRKLLQHSSPMVREAALTCFAGLTPNVFCSLPAMKQEFILSAAMHASQYDVTPAVRLAACRAVGVIVSFPEVSESEDPVTPILNVMLARMEDADASVRFTASGALANLCDALRSHMETVNSKDADTFMEGLPLAALAACSCKVATNDNEKVRANGVKALGNLAKFVNFGSRSFDASAGVTWNSEGDSNSLDTPAAHWLGRMVQIFVNCASGGKLKVQWNVCHALGNLFSNPSLHLSTMAWTPCVFDLLLMLLRSSESFKIRIQAASVLAVPALREDYGPTYRDVVLTVTNTLHTLDDNGVPPTSFKYLPALRDQLTSTALHVLALGHPQDYTLLQEVLQERTSCTIFWFTMLLESAHNELRDQNCGHSTETRQNHSTDPDHSDKVIQQNSGIYKSNDDEGQELNTRIGKAIQNRLVRTERAVKALSSMYIYGGDITTAQNLLSLI